MKKKDKEELYELCLEKLADDTGINYKYCTDEYFNLRSKKRSEQLVLNDK